MLGLSWKFWKLGRCVYVNQYDTIWCIMAKCIYQAIKQTLYGHIEDIGEIAK